MARFLALYMGSPDTPAQLAWERLSATERTGRTRQAMAAWGTWVQHHQSAIRDLGGPLGKTLLVSGDGIVPTSNALAGYVIVEAGSHREAAALFENHPHFSIFPGSGVEILECLAVPEGPQ